MKAVNSSFIALVVAALTWGGVTVIPTDAGALQCHVGTFKFFDGGGIESCRIDANHQFWTKRGERIVCVAGSLLVQHRNGAVARCVIPEPLVFGGTPCPAGATVELDDGGGLKNCAVAD